MDVEVEVVTSTYSGYAAAVATEVFVSFELEGQWSGFSRLATQAMTADVARRRSFKLSSYPSALKMQLRDPNPSVSQDWAFWKVSVNGAVVLEDPNGKAGRAKKNSKYWLDTNDANAAYIDNNSTTDAIAIRKLRAAMNCYNGLAWLRCAMCDSHGGYWVMGNSGSGW